MSSRKSRCNVNWVPQTHWLNRGNPATSYEANLSRGDGERPATGPRRGLVTLRRSEMMLAGLEDSPRRPTNTLSTPPG
jgi:hypothetical protein